jgi:transcriptional regulator GlxA family with amidase domain
MSLVKHFLLDTERTSQAAFMVFTGQKKHGNELVLKVQEYIELNYREKINIDQLAETFAVVRRTLERKFKKATHNSIAEYAQRIKIEAAKKAIEGGRKTMHEIMYEVGYSDMKAFRDLFHGITGLTPVAYKNKFNKPISLY